MFVTLNSFLHRVLVVTALLLLWPAATETAQAQPTTAVVGTLPEDYLPQLKSIIDTALKQSPTMLLQNTSLAQTDAGLIAGQVAFWPSVGASGSYTVSVANAGGANSTASGAYYSISASEQLYAWGANKATADIARLSVQITRRQWAEAFRTLAGSLRAQYLGLIVQNMALRNANSQLQMTRIDLARQEQLQKDGAIPAGVVGVLRLGIKQQTLAFDQAVQGFAHARRMFAHLAGLDDIGAGSIPPEIPHLSPAPAVAQSVELLNGFIHGGVEDTPTSQVYVMQLKQSDLNLLIQKTRLYPKFSMGASYNVSNSQSVVGNGVTQSLYKSYNLGVNGNWTIFDGFSTRAGKMSVLAAKRGTERQLRDYVDTTTEAVLDGHRQVDFAARTLEMQEQALSDTKAGLDQTRTDLKDGNVAQVAVDNMQTAVNATEYAANVARANFLRTWSDFVSQVGADPVLAKVPSGYIRSNHDQ